MRFFRENIVENKRKKLSLVCIEGFVKEEMFLKRIKLEGELG